MFFRYQSVVVLFSTIVILMSSCGSGGSGSKAGSTLKVYQPAETSTQLRGSFDGINELDFVLYNDQHTDTITFFSISNGELDVALEQIPANEIYFLEIKGQAEGYDEGVQWIETVPLYLEKGVELELVSEPYEGEASLSNRRFHLEGGGEEQEFLEAWHREFTEKQIELDAQITRQFVIGAREVRSQRRVAETNREALDRLNRKYIDQNKPMATTLFLISQENDHRSKVDQYSAVYDNAPAEVQNTKYGVDLNNRLVRITQFNPQLDFDKLLAARNSKLLNFEPSAFSDQEYLVLSFWSSRFPQAAEDLPAVEKMVSEAGNDEIAVIHFSLDTKMSSWRAANDKIGLNNSYLVRAEVRQDAIDELYLTELPRYMVVKPDGTVVENDVPFEDLEEVIKSL